MKVNTLKNWANAISPLAWQRIVLKLLPEFKKEGFLYNTITDDKMLSNELFKMIDDAVYELYKVRFQVKDTSLN